MSDPSREPGTLWGAVAAAQEGAISDPQALDRLRTAIVQPSAVRVSFPHRWMAAFAVALLLGIGFWGLSLRRPSFQAGAGEGAVGMVLAAEGAALPLRFADGSRVVLSPHARAQVNRLSETGAEVVLAGGALEAQVVHSEATRWVFHAGPYEILVTGTRFVAEWRPEAQTLKVRMQEGSVRITGGGLQAEVPVRAGQEFSVVEGSERYALTDVPAVAADPAGRAPTGLPAEAEVRPGDPERSAAQGPSMAPAGVRAKGPGLDPSKVPPADVLADSAGVDEGSHWARAAAAGDHGRAFSLAKRRGIRRLTRHLSAPDLLLLADTARYVHEPEAAAQAFSALVMRFPQAPEASDALFGLGRLAFQDRRWREAAGWFRRIVDQQAEGPLVEAAWGRLMESLDRADDPSAPGVATAYLEAFAQGQHRALAERIRARPAP